MTIDQMWSMQQAKLHWRHWQFWDLLTQSWIKNVKYMYTWGDNYTFQKLHAAYYLKRSLLHTASYTVFVVYIVCI